MKKLFLLTALSLSLSAMQAQDMETYTDSVSYAIGVLWGQNIKQQGFTEINADMFSKAISEVLAGEETQLDLRISSQLIKEHMNREQAEQKMKNKAEGEAFLSKNAEREGVVTLPSGLQYEILKEGTGPIPSSTDKVTVHYEGRLVNGDVFDSSLQRGEPATFPVTGVIKGWVEALQLMPTGSKWKLFIPADLAYGDRGAGGQIGPAATLVFEVELLGIENQ